MFRMGKISLLRKLLIAVTCLLPRCQSLSSRPSKLLKDVKFDNKNMKQNFLDKELENFSRTVPNAIFSLVKPTPVENPKVVSISVDVLNMLGVTIKEDESEDDICSRNDIASILRYETKPR